MTLESMTFDPVTFDRMWSAIKPIGHEASTGGYRRYAWTRVDATLREWFVGEAAAPVRKRQSCDAETAVPSEGRYRLGRAYRSLANSPDRGMREAAAKARMQEGSSRAPSERQLAQAQQMHSRIELWPVADPDSVE